MYFHSYDEFYFPDHTNVVKLLIENGADVNATEEVKESQQFATYTAIQDATMSGN